jgi:hypothetical protein
MRQIRDWVYRSISLRGEAVILSTAFIDGNLAVEEGARVAIQGIVAGDLVIGPGSIVVLGGTVLGSVYNGGGTLHLGSVELPNLVSKH